MKKNKVKTRYLLIHSFTKILIYIDEKYIFKFIALPIMERMTTVLMFSTPSEIRNLI